MGKVAKFYYTEPATDFVGTFNWNDEEFMVRQLRPSVRYTFAAVYDDENSEIRFGVAKCNPIDNFCKKIGREIAVRNADEKPVQVIKGFKGRRNDYADEVMQIMKALEVKYLKKASPKFTM